MRKVKILILLLILCPLNVFAASYFDNQELTTITTSRAKAQMQVQAIAEEYLYKNLYTDYEQKTQDTYDITVKNNDYTVSDSDNTLSKTFSYRNLNMTPFELSRSNYNDTFVGNKEDIEAEEEDDGYIENRLESPKTSIGQEIINNIPDTAVFRSKLAIVIGLISLILGIIIIKQNMKKTNKN